MAVDEARRARNEALFREANERIRAQQRALGPPPGPLPFICECDRPECTQVVLLLPEEYEAVRADARRFVLGPGHPADGGTVVEEHDRYSVVEKDGVAGAVADETDPRKESR